MYPSTFPLVCVADATRFKTVKGTGGKSKYV